MTQEFRNTVKVARPAFIEAYRYLYGATAQEANEAYKKAEPSYTHTIVESYRYDARSSFYND